MKCKKCGYENPDDSNFCINCGEKIEKNSEFFCPHCGAHISSDSVFCSNCGKNINEEETIILNEESLPKEKMNGLAKVALILSIIAATITLFAFSEYIALGGLTIATIALAMVAVGLIAKKITGNIRVTIGLSLYGIVANILWIAFLVWMLPSF